MDIHKRKAGFLTFIFLFTHLIITGNESIGILESRFQDAQVDTIKIELLLQMGDHFEYTDYDSAIHFYEQALEISQNTENVSGKIHKKKLRLLEIKSLRYIIHLKNTWGKHQEAIDITKVLLEKLYELDMYKEVITFKLNIGNNYYYLGDMATAVNYFTEALELAEEHNYPGNIASIHTNLAAIHYARGNYLKSLDHYQTALTYFQKHKNPRNEGLAYLGIGNIYSSMGNFSKAIENYNIALDLMDELEDHTRIANIHQSLGTLYYEHQDLENAEKHYQKALHHAEINNDMRTKGQALLNMGILYARHGKHLKALENYEKALTISLEADHKHTQASVLRNKALTLMRMRNFTQATQLAKEGFQLAKEVESLEDQAESLKVLSRISQEQGSYASALTYFQEYKHYSDSLLNIENQRQINEMDAMFQSEQKQQKIDLQSLEIEKNQIELRQKNQMVNTIFMVLAFVIIFTVATLLHYNQKKITNMEIAKQKAIISDNTDLIKKQEERLEEARGYIVQLENDKALQLHQAAQTLHLAEIISEKNNQCPNELRQIFANKFFEVHLGKESQPVDICTVRQLKNHILIIIADTQMLPVDKKLINIALSSFVDQHLKVDFIKKINEYTSQLKDYLDSILSGLNNEEHNNKTELALLLLDKTDHKVRFVSDDIILGLAIARNPGSIFKPMFDYQELQMIDPSGRIFDNPGNNSAFSGIFEFKLKPSDRLYLINPEKQLSESTGKESFQQVHRSVVNYIDSHQNMEISLQGEYIEKELKKQMDEEVNIRHLTVRGLEI